MLQSARSAPTERRLPQEVLRRARASVSHAQRTMSEEPIEIALQCGAAFASGDYTQTLSTLTKVRQQRENGTRPRN